MVVELPALAEVGRVGISESHRDSISVSTTPGTLDSMDMSEKVRENRLRRMAKRQGFKLVKTRRLDPLAIDYETYRLVPVKGEVLLAPAGA